MVLPFVTLIAGRMARYCEVPGLCKADVSLKG